jgi:hypothetical protein
MPYSGNFLSDGGSVTNAHSADADTDNFETVAEVQIEDSNFSAQYGIGGSVFSQITKGGENKFHGAAYEHFQNDDLEARSYFAAPGVPVGPLKYNQFGGSIGGPIFATGCSSISTTKSSPITRPIRDSPRCLPIR